jgi:hypothetical protein
MGSFRDFRYGGFNSWTFSKGCEYGSPVIGLLRGSGFNCCRSAPCYRDGGCRYSCVFFFFRAIEYTTPVEIIVSHIVNL